MLIVIGLDLFLMSALRTAVSFVGVGWRFRHGRVSRYRLVGSVMWSGFP